MNALAAIKRLFAKPSAQVIAREELEEARRELLAAQNAQEFYSSQCIYQTTRIARLQRYVSGVAE